MATWDIQRVEETFLPIDVPAIMGIPICTRNINYYWAWNFERYDSFSVCSAYGMLLTTRQRREAWLDGTSGSSSSRRDEKSWKLLWNTQFPAKIRMFLWRLSKHTLPTEDVRAQVSSGLQNFCIFKWGRIYYNISSLSCSAYMHVHVRRKLEEPFLCLGNFRRKQLDKLYTTTVIIYVVQTW